MNYLILRSIVEATISHFSCKNCDSKVSEKDVHILGTAGNALNLEITCPHCKASGVVKAEVNVLSPHQAPVAGNADAFFGQLGRSAAERAPSIRDEDILKLRETLKNSTSVNDFLS